MPRPLADRELPVQLLSEESLAGGARGGREKRTRSTSSALTQETPAKYFPGLRSVT